MLVAALDPGAIVTTAISGLTDTLGTVAAPALAVGGSVLALTFGWRFVKKFIS